MTISGYNNQISGYKPPKSEQIIKIYNEVQRKILLFGESALSPTAYPAFRRLVVSEFGHGGAKDKIKALFGR